MASERNRIINIKKYIESCGVEVNIAKNKARGNKGFFKAKGTDFRIDIAKNQTEDSMLSILAHEFAHYAHYCFDKTLKNLDFVFDKPEEVYLPELLDITVDSIPRHTIEPLFNLKEELKQSIATIQKDLSLRNIDYIRLEQKIKKTKYKYLLSHDRVKVWEGFFCRYYSIAELNDNSDETLFLKLKSKQRALKRVNSKINKLNKYYNSPTELFARSFEMYITDKDRLFKIAPNIYQSYEDMLFQNKNELLKGFIKNLNN